MRESRPLASRERQPCREMESPFRWVDVSLQAKESSRTWTSASPKPASCPIDAFGGRTAAVKARLARVPKLPRQRELEASKRFLWEELRQSVIMDPPSRTGCACSNSSSIET